VEDHWSYRKLAASIFRMSGSRFLWNGANCLQEYTVSWPGRPQPKHWSVKHFFFLSVYQICSVCVESSAFTIIYK